MFVLVTGGMGYIGSHTCIQMIEAGMTPIIFDNLYNSKSTVLDRISKRYLVFVQSLLKVTSATSKQLKRKF